MELKITPSVQRIVKPTALGPVANTDTKLLIYGLFQKEGVLAQLERARKPPFATLTGVVAPLWLRAKSAYGGGRGMFPLCQPR